MASDPVHTVEILVKDLSTKSVDFTPERATVVREVQDIAIKPGPNEITIYGLDPDVDLDSIRVTGRGPATITDIQTDIVPQREQFKDAFPDDSDDEGSETEVPDSTYGVDKSELEAIEMEIEALNWRRATVEREQATATKSLEFLDNYGKSMDAKDVEVSKMESFLKSYQEQRNELGETYDQCLRKLRDMNEQESELSGKQRRLHDAWTKATNAAAKEDRKQRENKRRENEVKKKQKERVITELWRFWPQSSVSQVVLYLDGFPAFTPSSSRSNSMVSSRKPEPADTKGSDTHSETVSFSLTYVTSKANWSPRYELSLETPSSSGRVVYLAQYQNFSSETWKDANLSLTTSQTRFSGLNEKIPRLQGWHVKLDKGQEGVTGKRASSNWSGGLENNIEISARIQQQMQQPKQPGSNNPFSSRSGYGGNQAQGQQQAISLFSQQKQSAPDGTLVLPLAPQATGGLFGNSVRAGGSSLFGSGEALYGGTLSREERSTGNVAASPFAQTTSTGVLVGGDNQEGGPSMGSFRGNYARDEGSIFDKPADLRLPPEVPVPDIDDRTLGSADNVLAFQESSRQDYGLTTTYDIPGRRTVPPSSLKRRHVIAELDLASISLSHIIIPKLRSAAFLKAKIKNTSPVALLGGKAGLTLDGTFLGTTTIPSCSPDSTISLPLGVDPGIHVTYAKPTVRRATSGFFNKEDCAVFTRICWINNTKSTPVNVLVMEEIPLSEDERLHINILEPKGLEKEGDKVKAGQAGNWGTGFAIMGKEGQVKWEITIQKGKQAKLVLEYEARIPSGQRIVGLD